MRFLFLYIILVIILNSCGSETNGNAAFGEDFQNKNEYSKELFDAIKIHVENAENDSLFSDYSQVLMSLYSKHGYAPFWFHPKLTITEDGKRVEDMVCHSMSYGLDTNRYQTKLLRRKLANVGAANYNECAVADVLLSKIYLKFGKDLNAGITDTSQYHAVFGRKHFKVNLEEYFIEHAKDSSLGGGLEMLQPQIAEYQKLQKGLQNFLSLHVLKDSSMEVEKYTKKHTEKDSIRIYNRAKEVLVMHDYLDDVNTEDSIFLKQLKAFQFNHGLKPDAKIGTNTAKALSGNPFEFYRRAAVSLEKWRWVEPDSLEEEYIFANIATYKLKVYKNEKLQEEHRVVVGAFDTQTPELDSEVEYMIAYPFWTVPYSIKTNEIVPKVKNDSTYLVRNNYELLKGGKVVEMSSVDWSSVNANNFNYTVRQKGGKSNALGVVKFIFPNKYSVYFHDTPSKGKFENDIRAFSHGCVRVDKPLELAEYLLARESETFHIDSLKAAIDRKERKTVTLKKKIPVHIWYFTAEGDEKGNVLIYPDYYKREKELEKLMFN